jgi:hypothetical protein
MHLLPNPFALPLLKVAIHRAVWRQVVGQHFPLASRSLNVEDAIKNLSKIDLDWMPKAFGLRQKRSQDRPFRITQVAWIRFALRVSNFR